MAYDTPDTVATAPGALGDQDPKNLEVAQNLDPDFEDLSPEDIEGTVGAMIDDARNFIGEELDGIRGKATDYYMGRPFGNEEEGRSQVVSTDVRDTVRKVLPSLIRVFFAPEHIVEFRARKPDGEPEAVQATEYINYVIMEDNDGFETIHAALKDALVRKTGIVKWWWDDAIETEGAEYTGLSQDNLLRLMLDPELRVQVTAVEQAAPEAPPTYAATTQRVISTGRARLGAVPPECIAWNRNARNFDDAVIVVHTDDVPFYQLLAMGYKREDLEEAAGLNESTTLSGNSLETARRFDRANAGFREQDYQGDTRLVRYDEAYVRIKLTNGEPACLYKICFVGTGHKMVGEPKKIRRRPFALFVADPEPHTVVGLDYADYTMDIQRIKSNIWRGSLDSLSLTLIPRVEAVEGMVNMADLLNTEVGGVIRVRQPGMLREVTHSFVGEAALPMLQYADDVKEQRTGQSKASVGLDPDALQSTTKSAVAMTRDAAQQQLELLARTFAEMGFRQLYRGLLELICEHQDRTRTIRLRGEYVEIDPRGWDATMDVSVNVGLGNGLIEDRITTLAAIAEKQEMVLQSLGPANPLVSLRQYRNTLARMVELAGYKNAQDFFKEITPEMEAQMDAAAANAPKQPQGDPAAMALAEVEKQKVQIQAMKAAADIEAQQQANQLKAREIELADDRERDRHAADIAMQLRQQEMEHEHAMAKAEVQARVDIERARIDAEVAREKMRIEHTTKLEVADINAEAKVEGAQITADAKPKETSTNA